MNLNFHDYLLIALIIITPIIYVANIHDAKNTIQGELESKGSKDVIVRHEWLDFDRNTMTFSVEYADSNGNKFSTRCKIHRWGIFLSDEVYWSSILDLEPKQTKDLSEKIRSNLDADLPTSEISIALSIPNSEDIIVMMKYITSFRNVFRCKPDGSILWQAELPTETGDVYTNIEWQGGKLTAYSRSCISVNLDPNTGKILPSQKVTNLEKGI
jgi:hypothetical protein